MTVEFALDKLYSEALKKTGIVPVAQAVIKEVVSQSPLKVIMHIEVLPEVKISNDYKKIKLKKQKVSIKKEEVEAALEDIQNRFAKFEEVKEKNYKVQM
jgi:FKBP-type peptidyl-prolyl cis-trans isomerase (trigger factor)